jgi:biopolymer transport protein ExbD
LDISIALSTPQARLEGNSFHSESRIIVVRHVAQDSSSFSIGREAVLRFVKEPPAEVTEQRLPMSSMIDIVFLLLVFLVMTFRVTSQEGDFEMERPDVAGSGRAEVTTNLPLQLELGATPEGELNAIALNGQRVASLHDLQLQLIALNADGALRDVVMTLDCEATLKYQNVITVLDHVTAYRDTTGQKKPLIASTKFAVRR